MVKYKVTREMVDEIIDKLYLNLEKQLGVNAHKQFTEEQRYELLFGKTKEKAERLHLSTVLVGLPNGKVITKLKAIEKKIPDSELAKLPCIYEGVNLLKCFRPQAKTYKFVSKKVCKDLMYGVSQQNLKKVNGTDTKSSNPAAKIPAYVFLFGESDNEVHLVATSVGLYQYAKDIDLKVTEDTPLAEVIKAVESDVGELLFKEKLTPGQFTKSGGQYVEMDNETVFDLLKDYLYETNSGDLVDMAEFDTYLNDVYASDYSEAFALGKDYTGGTYGIDLDADYNLLGLDGVMSGFTAENLWKVYLKDTIIDLIENN